MTGLSSTAHPVSPFLPTHPHPMENLIYINSVLIDWLSKKQSTIETSVFGAEFIAMKMGLDRLRGLPYDTISA